METGVRCPDVQESVAEDPQSCRDESPLGSYRKVGILLTLYHGLRRPFAHVTSFIPCPSDPCSLCLSFRSRLILGNPVVVVYV